MSDPIKKAQAEFARGCLYKIYYPDKYTEMVKKARIRYYSHMALIVALWLLNIVVLIMLIIVIVWRFNQ